MLAIKLADQTLTCDCQMLIWFLFSYLIATVLAKAPEQLRNYCSGSIIGSIGISCNLTKPTFVNQSDYIQ